MSDLSLASMDRLLRKSGAERISEGACAALAEALEARGQEIGAKAIKYANHAGRKTITEQDVKLARSE
ncbi:Archaeal histone HAN1 subunit A [Candidatus Gugararchaeum adminiculabundum]|nr:Archaeal histone HAN1 subunit A [Candidatus Gugararchaeum adminiculabundum]